MNKFILLLVAALVFGTSFGNAAGTGQVTIENVQVRMTDHGYVVMLKAEGKVIPVFVDPTVALSIHGALSGEKTARPLSHDLMHTILAALNAKVTQVVITMHGGTYFGALSVATKETTKVFDSRSSDAIALAIHFKAPILVGRDLLDSAGISLKEQGGAETL
jgi:uncharacterized protein